MKKMLMLASVASMIDQFNMSNIDILKKQGFEVHVAANFKYGNTSSEMRIEEFKKELNALNITYHQIDFSRNISDIFSNIKAYAQVINLMKLYNYQFIHCHSPIGGVCGRLAAYKMKIPVIYTAHGFHFYKGAAIQNWLIYYPVEKILSKYTDILITINKEDYEIAQKFKAKKVVYVPGVGIDPKKFSSLTFREGKIKEELGITNDSVVLLSIGELIKRKNHETVLRALATLNRKDFIYLVCGKGELENYLKSLATSLGIEEKVRFLGFRKDIPEICEATDVFVFPSLQEGLPVSVMEAMSAQLPIIGSEIRGNTDLIKNGVGGFLLKPTDIAAFATRIEEVIDNQKLREEMGSRNAEIVKKFSKSEVSKLMWKVYENK